MEIPSIRNQAERQLQEARYANRNVKYISREEIPKLKKEKTARKQAILTFMLAVVRQRGDTNNIRALGDQLRAERHAASLLRSKEYQARSLEHTWRATMTRARIFTDLMRRARSGNKYAKHQADLVTTPRTFF